MVNIYLERWTLDHKAELSNICNKADRTYLANRMPYPYTDEDAVWWLDMTQKEEGTGGIYRAIIADGLYVGNISVEKKNDVYGRDGEIGYMLLAEQWSKGIGTEAVRQVCDIAFNQLDIIRITGLVYKPNVASRRVLEKNGFSLEGIMRQAVCKNDHTYDLCVYGKLISGT